MLKVIHFITSLLLLIFSIIASAQQQKITIEGQFDAPEINFAEAIVTLEGADQTIIKNEILESNGRFVFAAVPTGLYRVNLLSNGKPQYQSDFIATQNDLNLGTIAVHQATTALDEVIITKSKPYIERQDGKMILNVENTIVATGSSAFEVLERAPGVNVDANDNLSLRGKTGLIIQIDGKATPMSGSNLANYLRGMPSGSVEKIEFLTNPSSKYDASGTAIINIKLKKNKRKGSNANLAISGGKGRYFKNSESLGLNHRTENLNLFGSYAFAYREGFNKLLLQREFFDGNTRTGTFDQDNYLRLDFRNHIARAGVDYLISPKHTLGVVVSGVNNRFNPTGTNSSDVYDGNGMLASRFATQNHSKDKWHNYTANLNYKFVIDTTGTECTTDLDFAQYGNKTNQQFDTHYYNLDGSQQQPSYNLFGDLQGHLRIYALKSDFVTRVAKTKIEAGLKTSSVKADNAVSFFDRSLGGNHFDATKSNHFIYEENINAAYMNSSRESGKWDFQLGLRVENTNISGKQLVDQTRFDSHYTQWFPTALAGYRFNDHHALELSYSRRIQRPGYDQLNPFKFYLDPTTYKAGNPYLKPQNTHAVELTHSLDQKIFTTLSFSRTYDNITETISPSLTEAQVTVQSLQNLKYADVYGLFVVWPIKPALWWDSANNLNAYVGSYTGNVANTPLTNAGNFTWNVSSNNNFKLGNGFFAELSADYRGQERYAFDLIDPIWFANAGLQKKFANTGTIKLAITDIFNTNRIKARVNYTGYQEHFDVSRDTRVATISYTYNFGGSNVSTRGKPGAADDLKQRAGRSNG